MCSESNIKLIEKIKEILPLNGINEPVAEVLVQDSGAKGDGLASLTQSVTVAFENDGSNNVVPPLQFFVKLHTTNPSHEVMLNELKAFEKEATFFMNYLPEAKKFCASKGLDKLLDIYPKCYHGDEHMIVLEDLVRRGYEMLPYDHLHDFEIASLALKNLATHHAVSYAMIQEYGGSVNFFKKFQDLDYDGFFNPMMTAMIESSFEMTLKNMTTVLMKNKIEGGQATVDKLNSLSGKTLEMVLQCLRCNVDSDPLLVLNHGDYKGNNMMFLKEKGDDNFAHHIAIDLQITRYNSPALDLVSYLFSTVQPALRRSKLKELLQIYLDNWNKVTSSLDHPRELSYEELLMMYRKIVAFGFCFGLTLIGPGMTLMKKVDVDKVDMSDFTNVINGLLIEWMAENPEKGVEMAEDIKKLVDEYSGLEIV